MKKLFKRAFKRYQRKKIIKLIQSIRPQLTDKLLIRFGPNTDGGYLIPNDINNIEACFSPGVGKISGFEKDCRKRGMVVYLADASVDNPEFDDANFHFLKKFVGEKTEQDFISIRDWINQAEISSDSDLLLQMDIEGYEFEVIQSMSENLLNRFRIIVIEFHHLQKLWSHFFFKESKKTFKKLLNNHTCVHIHPNNYKQFHKYMDVTIPRAAEFTFLRNDRIKFRKPKLNFPDPLDFDNTVNSSLVLPKIWYT